MRTRTQYPCKVRVIHHAVIPLSDGINLSAMIWLPENAESAPVPAILEYIPYRKRDSTSERDALNHPYFAGHGYAAVRVDIRGSGDSEGVLHGEYLEQEQDDALEILAWIAAQDWCTGSIGMIGISWGGFNGLQVAARRPPELKAVVSLCSTDDRYADDIHSMGGSLLIDKVSWGSTMFAINATPPDPALVGEQWRDMWMDRLNHSGFWIEEWHRHQRRDDLYKQGSICEDYDAIQCPVYLVGGWADGYSNAVFRMMENLQSPRKGLVGPWGHKYPNFAKPGPRIGFLQECLRWWDQCLKGIDNGIMEEPGLRVWMQDTTPPQTYREQRSGRWIAEDSWPSPHTKTTHYPLGLNRLENPGSQVVQQQLEICSPQTVGLASGKWCPYGLIPDQPDDQRLEAGGSLVFDSEPLTETFEFFGAAIAHLDIAADKPDALVAVTLCEVLPNGAVTRLSYGILNLTHRDSHENPSKLEPGKRYQVQVKLNDCAQSLSPGSRLRLAISSSYWPVVWPSPEAATLSVQCGTSSLELPLRDARTEDDELTDFEPAENSAELNATRLRPIDNDYKVTRDIMTGRMTLDILGDEGLLHNDDTDWTFGSSVRRHFSILPDDPLSASVSFKWRKEFARDDLKLNIKADTHMSVSKSHFIIKATLDAYEGKDKIFSNQWNCEIPRDHT
jgi:putative CocE/NonD family hydrolase